MWMTRAAEGDPLRTAFAREEFAGLRFAFRLRLVALLTIAGWLVHSIPETRVLYYLGLIALFVVLGGVPLLLRRHGLWRRAAIAAAVMLLDAALPTCALLSPNPLAVETWPPQIALRFHSFNYFFVSLSRLGATCTARSRASPDPRALTRH